MKLMRTPAVPTRRLKLQATVWEKNKCQCFVNCLLLTCVSWCECLKENLNFAGVLHPPGNAEIEEKHGEVPYKTSLPSSEPWPEGGTTTKRTRLRCLQAWNRRLAQVFTVTRKPCPVLFSFLFVFAWIVPTKLWVQEMAMSDVVLWLLLRLSFHVRCILLYTLSKNYYWP